MYLKHLKFLHTLMGLALITGYLISYTVLTRLYPDVYPNHTVVDILLSSNSTLLLATATANLLLGTYLVGLHGNRRLLQMTGSLLVILSGLSAAIVTFARLPQMPGDLTVALFPLGTLIAGLAAHLLCNLRALNPKTRLIIDTSDRETGTVKWFNISKGFGFITRDQGEDVFVHYRAIRGEGHRTLAEGQRVEFIVTKKEKGLQAEDVISAPTH